MSGWRRLGPRLAGSLQSRAGWACLFGMLLVAITYAGLGLVTEAQRMRDLYGQMAVSQKQQDTLLEEHSRLMLERGSLTRLHTIEAVAQTELGMHFPELMGDVLQ